MMKTIVCVSIVLVLCFGLHVGDAQCFSDIPSGYWAEAYINAIYDARITTGYGGTNEFKPDIEVSRDQMAAFITRAKEGEPISGYCASGVPSTDVDLSGWACPYIKRLYELNITQGYGGTNQYRPEVLVTRDQMAAFIIRAKEGEPVDNYCDSGSPFTDVPTSSWSCKYIKRLYELGVTIGYGGTAMYRPELTVTRAQMAAFIGRAFLNMYAIDWQAYLNYQVGRAWQYETIGDEGTYSEYIKEITTKNGFTVYVKGWSSNYSDWLDYWTFGTDGVYSVGYYDEDQRADVFFFTSCWLLPNVVQLGTPFSVTCASDPPTVVEETFELVNGVTVPYGTFDNVIKVTRTSVQDGTRIGWHAKGVGLIRDYKASTNRDHPLLNVTDGHTSRPTN